MRRLALLIAFLAAPSPAAAAIGELPFEPMAKRARAECLHPTGAPGELALLGPRSGRTAPLEFRAAGPGGTARGASVNLGSLLGCPVAAGAPGGPAVVAGVVARRPLRAPFTAVVVAAARDAGGQFGQAVRLAAGSSYLTEVSAAVSQSGHGVVAWAQIDGFQSRGRGRVRILVSRRAPDGSFGPGEALTPWISARWLGETKVAAAIDARGTATVAWLRPLPKRGTAVETATAAPAGAFAVDRVATTPPADDVALAVASDGWALLAHDGVDGLSVFERPPGGRFTGVSFPGRPWRGEWAPVVAVRDGGGALVAWRTAAPESFAGVLAATRAGPGGFGRARTIAPERRLGAERETLVAVLGGPDERLRAALAPDGRAVLAWTIERRLGGDDGVVTPRMARGTLTGGFGAPVRLGSPLRDTDGVVPLFLPDGREAVAWTDNADEFGDDGRLHLALDSAPAVRSPPPPKVTLHSAPTQRLYASEPLEVAVRCDRACDVRAAMPRAAEAAGATLLRAGRVSLDLPRAYPPRGGRVRVVVRATGPDGRRIATASQHIRVIRRPALPVPRPTAVRARRRGDAIVVSWRTATPARRTLFGVEGRRNRRRGRNLPDYDATGFRFGRGRTRFQVRLTPGRPDRVRWIAVHANSLDSERGHTVVVRVNAGRSSASG